MAVRHIHLVVLASLKNYIYILKVYIYFEVYIYIYTLVDALTVRSDFLPPRNSPFSLQAVLVIAVYCMVSRSRVQHYTW